MVLTGHLGNKVITVLRQRILFQTHAAGFARSSYPLQRGEKVFTSYNSIKKPLIKNNLFFKIEKVLLNCSWFTLLIILKIIITLYAIVS